MTRELRKKSNGQLTVNDLLKVCQQAVAEGNGDKFIMLSDDNEGNGYHGMFYGLTDVEGFDDSYFSDTNLDKDNLIVLG